MDKDLAQIEKVAKLVLQYIETRRNGFVVGKSKFEKALGALNRLTGSALVKAEADPDWNFEAPKL